MYGWVAGGLSALHNVPQIVHVCRRGSAGDLGGVDGAHGFVVLLRGAWRVYRGFAVGGDEWCDFVPVYDHLASEMFVYKG